MSTATALILDVQHRALLVDGKLLSTTVQPGERPLTAITRAAQQALSLDLEIPLGRDLTADDALFVFVLPNLALGAVGSVVPLRTWATRPELARAWDLYTAAILGGWPAPTRALDVYYFGDTPLMAARLAHLIVKGHKRGTTGWVAALDHIGWTPSYVGMISIVTDGFGIPLCAIEIVRVERGRFCDATEEIAIAEGEGDLSLPDWQLGHRAYFEAEAARTGLSFTDDAVMTYEYFEVRHVFRRA